MPPVKSSCTWNPERVAKLRELVASGLSSAAIAVALGVSHGAVCSARVRYGIVPTARPQRQRQPEPARPARRAAQSTSARAPWSIWPASPRLEPEPLPPVDPFDLAIAGVPLIELEAGHCRWPLPEPTDGITQRFCGEPAERGCAYCARHYMRSIRAFWMDDAAPDRPEIGTAPCSPRETAPDSCGGSMVIAPGRPPVKTPLVLGRVQSA
jgi:hypothetical protein